MFVRSASPVHAATVHEHHADPESTGVLHSAPAVVCPLLSDRKNHAVVEDGASERSVKSLLFCHRRSSWLARDQRLFSSCGGYILLLPNRRLGITHLEFLRAIGRLCSDNVFLHNWFSILVKVVAVGTIVIRSVHDQKGEASSSGVLFLCFNYGLASINPLRTAFARSSLKTYPPGGNVADLWRPI